MKKQKIFSTTEMHYEQLQIAGLAISEGDLSYHPTVLQFGSG